MGNTTARFTRDVRRCRRGGVSHSRWRVAWFVVATIGVLASGWIGAAVNAALGQQGMDGLGTLLWLVMPLLVVVVARLARGAASPLALRPRLREAWPWYLVAVVVYPLLCAYVVVVGVATGLASSAGLDLVALGSAFAIAVGPNLVKNVFEESVWRGYFVGEPDARRWSDWAVYGFSGLIWGLWHVPYYLYFLPEEQLRAVLDVSPGTFAALACVVMMLWGVLFTELFRLAGSIWPLVLIHAMEDATINPLVQDGHVRIEPGFEWLLSPTIGIVPAMLLCAVGLWLRRVRRRQAAEAQPLR